MPLHRLVNSFGFGGLLGVLVLVALLLPGVQPVADGANPKLQGSHAGRSLLPKTCRACHKGMNMSISGEEATCLSCHGSDTARAEMVQKGYLKLTGGVVLADIGADLRKPYNHPVMTVQGVHRKLETLPEEVVNAARHAECVDCHDAHLTDKQTPYRGLRGRGVGNFSAQIEQEYQLCYKCHSESANLPGNSTNKHGEFRTSNPSFHPVEGEGRNTYVISLKAPYVAKKERPSDISIISCRDCHGSDDPDGPRGPHGSTFQGLLTANYQMEDGRPESTYAYDLCYKCHDRNSILRNESFPYHSLHIQGRLAGQDGTSCFSCHDAHGSSQYQHLIRFNDNVVSPTKDNKLKYDAKGYSARHGACYLNCHGVEHNPKEY